MSEAAEPLHIVPYKRHIMMCAGKSCGENLPLFRYLKQQIKEAGLDQGDAAIRVNRAGCLGVCQQGPIMVAYPEGAWYANMSEAKVDTLIAAYAQGAAVVDALLFHRQP